jgi:hypothetical protein
LAEERRCERNEGKKGKLRKMKEREAIPEKQRRERGESKDGNEEESGLKAADWSEVTESMQSLHFSGSLRQTNRK